MYEDVGEKKKIKKRELSQVHPSIHTCVRVRVCVCVRARACVRACVIGRAKVVPHH